MNFVVNSRYKVMYSSFNDIFLMPAPCDGIECVTDDIIVTAKGRYVILTHQMLEQMQPGARYRVLWRHKLWRQRHPLVQFAYGYVFMDKNFRGEMLYYRHEEGYIGMSMPKEELVGVTWILDIVRSSDNEAFVEFHSGLECNTAVNKRMIIGAELCMCMLSFLHACDELLERIRSILRYDKYDADLTHVVHTSELFAYTFVNSKNKLLYHELKRMYTHMRASVIVYLRRFVVPDTARMIVAMAYPWH